MPLLTSSAAAAAPSWPRGHHPPERAAPAPLAPLPQNGVPLLRHPHPCGNAWSAPAVRNTRRARGAAAGWRQLQLWVPAQASRQACTRAAGQTRYCRAGGGVCKFTCRLSTDLGLLTSHWHHQAQPGWAKRMESHRAAQHPCSTSLCQVRRSGRAAFGQQQSFAQLHAAARAPPVALWRGRCWR